MDVATIEMSREEAQLALDQYRDAVKDRTDDELELVMKGYRALAKGNALIKLADTMREAGVDDDGMPRLAICKADERWCRVRLHENGAATFIGYKIPGDTWRGGDQDHRARTRRVAVPVGTFPGFEGSWWDHPSRHRRAVVPIVPPQYRTRFALHNYHLLWEAEWQPSPPTDPMLLKRIAGDLFAVLAVWDLTDLERAVLGSRFADEP